MKNEEIQEAIAGKNSEHTPMMHRRGDIDFHNINTNIPLTIR
jgi:hypothetical protein